MYICQHFDMTQSILTFSFVLVFAPFLISTFSVSSQAACLKQTPDSISKGLTGL